MAANARSAPGLRRVTRWLGACTLTLALVLSGSAGAQRAGRALSDAQWRADISQAAQALAEVHPAPFRHVEQSVFDDEVSRLDRDVPSLSDRAIMIRLAQLTARIGDGHTRLTLPRDHGALFGIVQGHRETPPPHAAGLVLGDTPLRFGVFEEGVFVIGASEHYQRLHGARVLRFENTPVDEVLAAVRRTIAADSESGALFLAPDRLSLPGVLHALGAIERTDQVVVSFSLPSGAEEAVTVRTLTVGEPAAYRAALAQAPLALSRLDEAVWWTVLEQNAALYIQINEFEEFPVRPLADHMHDALAAADRHGAERVVLDLRYNQGGTGQFNAAIIRALIASEYNQYGRLYVLIGRQTFSAAQMLVNQLEQFTDAIFVGEPTGSRPTHFGDPEIVTLTHSGLTLRVSRIEWRSWLAGEFRAESVPHIDAPSRAADYFAGSDAVLQRALTDAAPETPAAQVEALFRNGKPQRAILRFLSYVSDPSVTERAPAETFVRGGRALIHDGLEREGHFMMVLVADYYPADPVAQLGMAFSLERRGEIDAARRRLARVLAAEPSNTEAQAALARLAQSSEQQTSGD